MKTLLKTLGTTEMFGSMERLQKEMKNDPQVEIVKMLCEIGVDLHQKTSYGRTALHMVCRGTKAISSGRVVKCHAANPRIVDILLEHGASVHEKDIHGCTPLHYACLSGNLEILRTLIQQNADVHASNGVRETPLHKACMGGHLEVVQELLKHKPDINAVANRYSFMTPFMLAALHGHFEIVEELLKHGADIYFSDPKYGSALHLATEFEYENILKTLLNNGCNTKVRAKLIYDDDLRECTAFEMALDMKSINIVKMIAFHET